MTFPQNRTAKPNLDSSVPLAAVAAVTSAAALQEAVTAEAMVEAVAAATSVAVAVAPQVVAVNSTSPMFVLPMGPFIKFCVMEVSLTLHNSSHSMLAGRI